MTAAGQAGSSDPAQEPRPPQERDGWRILSYMLGGMLLYGGIGWLIGHWILFPLGMILGIGLSIAMIIFRVTRS
jgi:ATP synthase protein I